MKELTFPIVNSISHSIIKSLEETISRKLNKAGIFFRVFFRIKSATSTFNKLRSNKYGSKNKIQDIIGGRIVLYFFDDIPICRNIIEQLFTIDNISEDKHKEGEFQPARLNYVCKIPSGLLDMFPNEIWEMPIDKTCELQIRTIFSEGWHEVEHDLRYKCKSDWEGNEELSRNLNGILATLETCDWAIMNLFEKLSYNKYKLRSWESMLRCKLRIRFQDEAIESDILEIISNNNDFWKHILRIDREKFLITLSSDYFITLPKTFNNVIFCANELFIHDNKLSNITPKTIKESAAVSCQHNNIKSHSDNKILTAD